ncbi:hypothetical protein pb186bvf_002664 [Paramecium bursaria]
MKFNFNLHILIIIICQNDIHNFYSLSGSEANQSQKRSNQMDFFRFIIGTFEISAQNIILKLQPLAQTTQLIVKQKFKQNIYQFHLLNKMSSLSHGTSMYFSVSNQ